MKGEKTNERAAYESNNSGKSGQYIMRILYNWTRFLHDVLYHLFSGKEKSSGKLDMNLKKTFKETLAWSIAVYASEAQTLTKADIKNKSYKAVVMETE